MTSAYYDVPLPLEGLDAPSGPAGLAEGLRKADEAIAIVDAHTQPEWKKAALDAVETLAHQMSDLTTDDVWHYLNLHDIAEVREPRALGVVMRQAQRLGMIEATDRTRRSDRPVCHANPKRVWRSLLSSGPSVRLASA